SRVALIDAKVLGVVKVRLPGCAKLGVFVRLKTSARNSKCVSAVAGNCLKRDRFNLRYGGPLTCVGLPPRFVMVADEEVAAAGLANAFGFRNCFALWLPAYGFPPATLSALQPSP